MAREGKTYVKTKIKGINKLRKTLNRLEPEEKAIVQRALAKAAVRIKRDAIGLAIEQDIRLTGDLIRSIEVQRSRDKMTAIIGPSARDARVRKNPFHTGQYASIKQPAAQIRSAEAQWNLMKGWWAEFGTEGPIEQDPQPFMNPAFDMNERALRQEVRRSVNKALKKAALGSK